MKNTEKYSLNNNNTTIWRLFDKYRGVKLKVSAILSLK